MPLPHVSFFWDLNKSQGKRLRFMKTRSICKQIGLKLLGTFLNIFI